MASCYHENATTAAYLPFEMKMRLCIVIGNVLIDLCTVWLIIIHVLVESGTE